MSDIIEFTKEGAVGVLTINNPPANALSFAVCKALGQIIPDCMADDDIAGLVITGAGRMFMAGADIREFNLTRPDDVPDFHDVLRAMEEAPKPIVAAINGVALGGGLELAMGCHYRLIAAGAQVGQPEIKLGFIPGAGGTQRLPRLIGKSRAKDLILTARTIGATEAHDLGLVNRLAAAPGREALDTCARDLADAIAQNGPVAVRAAKEAMELGGELPLAAGLEQEERCYAKTLATEDRLEALAAFAEKRPPHFKGR